jgi:hypothetical protein
MHSEIDVVTSDPVDRSVQLAVPQPQLDRLASTAQVAKHERHSESGRQRARRFLDASTAEALENLVARKQRAIDRVERHHALRPPAGFLKQFAGHPVASKGRGKHGDSGRVGEQQVERSILGRRRRRKRPEAITDAQPREAKTLLLGLQVDFFRSQLLLELAFEVVEQVVPAHEGTLGSRERMLRTLSTAPRRGRGQNRLVLL